MLLVALKMLIGNRVKYAGLLFGITFTSFLITFALSYFAGFMTRGFALISENPQANVCVMDPAVNSIEHSTNLPSSVLDQVRSINGVQSAVPLALGSAEVHFPNGQFHAFQVIGVYGPTLAGLPPLREGVARSVLRTPDAAVIDAGGTEGKLQTPLLRADHGRVNRNLTCPRGGYGRATSCWSTITA